MKMIVHQAVGISLHIRIDISGILFQEVMVVFLFEEYRSTIHTTIIDVEVSIRRQLGSSIVQSCLG